mgnify:CR=1 FL=1
MPQTRPALLDLSLCLVEGDEAALRRARCKALLVSVTVESALVAAMLLAPLVATSERPRLRSYVPMPPVRSTPQGPIEPPRPDGPRSTGPRRGPIIDQRISQPPRIPTQIDESGNSAQSAPEIPGLPPGSGPTGVIGGNDPTGPADTRRPTPPPGPAPSQFVRRIRTSEFDPAQLVHRIEPVYPFIAIQSRLQGTVRLRAIIGTDGSVRELELVSGNPILAQAALAAVAQWRYRPTLLNNQPVEVETHITVVFQLRR